MKKLGENIRKLRTSRGMTQQQLADVVGAKSYTTITKWESGDNAPRGGELVTLSKLFNVSVDSLLGIERKEQSAHDYHYLPTAISAGLPLDVEGITQAEKINIPDDMMGKWAGHSDIYVSRVNGASMNKVIPDGSLIAIKPVSLERLKDGDIVVYSYDNEYAVKRFYDQGDKIVFRPDSDDLSFTDQVIPKDSELDLSIKGKVVLYIVELD